MIRDTDYDLFYFVENFNNVFNRNKFSLTFHFNQEFNFVIQVGYKYLLQNQVCIPCDNPDNVM